MKPRLLAIEMDTWRLLLIAALVALWFLLVVTGMAEANDCVNYVKNPRNFLDVPQGLVEDCMRTGWVQALATGAIAAVGGGAIAVSVGQALTGDIPETESGDDNRREDPPKKDNPFDPTDEKKKEMWKKEHVIWDPQKLEWRPPRADEYPPPDDPPEKAPPYEKQNPRATTPPACLDLHDSYVKAQSTVQQLEGKINNTRDEYRLAQDWLQAKLGLFTAQFAVDMTDFFQLGVAGIRTAGPISSVLGKMGPIAELMRAAAQKAAAIARSLADLLKELAEIGARASRLRNAADVLTEAAKVTGRHADEAADAMLALDRRVGKNRQLLSIAEEVEGFKVQRNDLVSRVQAAEQRLKDAERLWQRRQELQRWAESERISITAEQARLNLAARAEVEAVRQELLDLAMKVSEHPEMRAVTQRVNRATDRHNHLQGQLQDMRQTVKEMDKQVEFLREATARKQRFLNAEDARDIAAEVVDKLDAEIRDLTAELNRLTRGLDELEAKQKNAILWQQQKKEDLQFFQKGLVDAQREEGAISFEIDSSDVDPTPDQIARLRKAREDVAQNRAMVEQAEMKEALARDQVVKLREEIAELKANSPDVEAPRERLSQLEAEKERARTTLTEAQEEYDRTAKELMPYSHPGVDLESLPNKEIELETLRQQIPPLENQVPAAKRELSDSWDAKDQVKQRLEADLKADIESRKQAAERKVQQTDRDWQQVAAERDGQRLQEWKQEVEGTNPFEAASGELEPLQREVLDLRKQEDAIEKQIADGRDKLQGEDAESLRRSLIDDEDALVRKRWEHDKLQADAESGRAEADKAREAAASAEKEVEAKNKEINNVKAQQSEVEAEMDKLRKDGASDVDPGTTDPKAKGAVGTIDALTKRSKELSDAMKPAAVKATEDAMKSAMAAFGKKWEQLFNGQSAEEVAEGIRKSRDKVIQLRKDLDRMTSEYDAAHAAMKDLKPRLDKCIVDNSYWSPSPNVKAGIDDL